MWVEGSHKGVGTVTEIESRKSREICETEYTCRFIIYFYFYGNELWNPCRKKLNRNVESILVVFLVFHREWVLEQHVCEMGKRKNTYSTMKFAFETYLIAKAPSVEPSLIVESFTNSCEIKSLAAPGIIGSLGNSRARATMFARVSSCSSPLKGVIP